jgi:hypothetical protein
MWLFKTWHWGANGMWLFKTWHRGTQDLAPGHRREGERVQQRRDAWLVRRD